MRFHCLLVTLWLVVACQAEQQDSALDGEEAMKHLETAQNKLKDTLSDMTIFIEGELERNKDSPMAYRKKRSTNFVGANGHEDRKKRSAMPNGHEDRKKRSAMPNGHEDRKKRSAMANGHEDRKKRSAMANGHEERKKRSAHGHEFEMQMDGLHGHEDRKKRSPKMHGHE